MIVIPPLFDKILQSNTSRYYIGAVNTTSNKFDEVFSENKLYFFEEYTDHGIRHINSVLAACSDLITPDTYKLLTEKDISVLILGVFLHDLGMHLQPLTFRKMITGGYDDVLSDDFGDEKWSVLWANYILEAKKFNDQQRERIFGDTHVHITEPDLNNPDSLTGIDKKLIGEFIRRHHPRIAFEIARKGLATHDGKHISFCTDFDEDYIRLAGLLARSHGMHLRDTFDILKKYYSRTWKKPMDIHIIYLMGVLRLADYFQIDSKRVLKIPFLTRQFKSPVSFAEHQKHLQTKNVQQWAEDPETLIITAAPENSIYFLALENLFNDIQKEVDNTWAILGEIYGLRPADQQPKLTYRRIIWDKKEFERQVPYVPEKISFTVDKEIPKLLVGPLYNYNPSFGVRELLQNAVDACLEKEFYEQKKGNPYEGLITVKIDYLKDHYQFSIIDNGKGMTLDEIKNYFLKVGGSFRKSPQWQADHLDEEGHSNVNKSGRFGIGVLAAYLLGSEIEVKTKSIFSTTGYHFKTSLNQEQIEINKDQEINVGTVIKINISHDVFDNLTKDLNEEDYSYTRFDQWYVLKSPKIRYEIYNFKNTQVGYNKFLPGFNEKSDNNWHEIYDKDFKKILWSYNEYFLRALICNGFFITAEYYLESGNIFNPPTLLVFDFDAKLPLSLNRMSVHHPLPFIENLETAIYKDILAMLLCMNIDNPFKGGSIKISSHLLDHPALSGIGFYDVLDTVFKIVCFEKGFTLNHSIFLNQLEGLNHLQIFHYFSDKRKISESEIIYQIPKSDVDAVSLIIFKDYPVQVNLDKEGNSFINKSNTIALTKNFQQQSKKKKQLSIKFEKALHDEFSKRWDFPENVSGIYYKIQKESFEPDLLIDLITNLLGEDLIIPYNIEDRKKKFPKAFKELEEYVRKYTRN